MQNWDDIEAITRKRLLDSEGAMTFANLDNVQQVRLKHIEVRDSQHGGALIAAPNILDPHTELQLQEPFHKYEQDEDFMYAINNLPMLFYPADKLLIVLRDYYAHYKRFAILAPEVTDYVLRAEAAFLHSRVEDRPPQLAKAYRLIYELMSQLVCVGDPNIDPKDFRVLYH